MQLLKGTEPGRSLEIGFGAGAFLIELERLGFETWGVEMNPACIESVVRRLPSALLDGPGSKRQLHEGGLKEMRVQRHKWGESDRH